MTEKLMSSFSALFSHECELYFFNELDATLSTNSSQHMIESCWMTSVEWMQLQDIFQIRNYQVVFFFNWEIKVSNGKHCYDFVSLLSLFTVPKLYIIHIVRQTVSLFVNPCVQQVLSSYFFFRNYFIFGQQLNSDNIYCTKMWTSVWAHFVSIQRHFLIR